MLSIFWAIAKWRGLKQFGSCSLTEMPPPNRQWVFRPQLPIISHPSVHPFTSFTHIQTALSRWRPSRAGSQAPSGGPLFSWHPCSLKSIPSGLKAGHWVLAAVKSRTTWISGKRCMEKYRKWYKVVSKAVRSLFFMFGFWWFLICCSPLEWNAFHHVSPRTPSDRRSLSPMGYQGAACGPILAPEPQAIHCV